MSDRHPLRRPLPGLGLAWLAAVAALAGCTLLRLVPPDVTLVDLEFTDLTLFETSGVFTVRLANENPEPLVVSGGVYNLYLGGLKVGKGLSDHRIEVPGLGTATDEVELHISNLAVATRLPAIFETGVVDYRIKAKIYVDLGAGRKRLTADHRGRFDMSGKEPPPAPADQSQVR